MNRTPMPSPAWRHTRPAGAASTSLLSDAHSTVQSDGAYAASAPRRAAQHGGASLWRRVTDWLAGDSWSSTSPAALSADARLPAARQALARQLADIQTSDAHRLVLRIGQAQSRQDLWHLRSAVFELVARVHSQAEAQSRLERLAPHFPLRTGPSSRH